MNENQLFLFNLYINTLRDIQKRGIESDGIVDFAVEQCKSQIFEHFSDQSLTYKRKAFLEISSAIYETINHFRNIE